MGSDLDRFLSKVDVTESCWIWRGSVDRDGYGVGFSSKLCSQRAHRAAYELIVGKIPDGLTLDHLCRNRLCVRPEHLEPVSFAVNQRRAKRLQTECKRGHPLPPVKRDTESFKRECLECGALRARRYRRERGLRGRHPKTHCPHGHELVGENLYINPAGARACRACRAIRSREFRERNR